MYIIGFTGKMGSGKTTAARMLSERSGFPILSFATPIKEVAKSCFDWDGKKDSRGRRLLQVIGTEAGREYCSDIWIQKLWEKILELKATDPAIKAVIIDDVRFNNEALFVNRYGYVFEIVRPVKVSFWEKLRGFFNRTSNHSSEAGLDKSYIEWTVDNSGSIDNLRDKITAIGLSYGLHS